MRADSVRHWLGIYFLSITLVLGAYILLFSETILLPISKQEGVAAFEIVVPVLVGQLAIVFQWFANPPKADPKRMVRIPAWVVKGPPIGIAVLIMTSVVLIIVGNTGEGLGWAPSPETFRAVVTFAVTVLNASTVIVVSQYFKTDPQA